MAPKYLQIKRLLVIMILYTSYCFFRESYSHVDDEKLLSRFDQERENGLLVGRREAHKWKQILLWTDFFGSKRVWEAIFSRLIQGECEEHRCAISFDKDQGPKADAVLFNAFNLRYKKNSLKLMRRSLAKMPNFPRNPRQVFIFYSMEAPTRLDWEYLKKIPNFFNWTMTYRRDSDVFEPFGIVRSSRKGENWEKHTLTEADLKKKRMAAWLSSNCFKNKPYLRENFVKYLQQYIRVDLFGKCGKKCDGDIGIKIYGSRVGNSNCENTLKKYIFYLSFENSLCADYLTEKVFKALMLGIIPVVFGEGDYASVLPKGSYIDYRDFNSVEQLAEYMKKVASNITLFNGYMEWKKSYSVEIGSPYKSFVCDLCKKLHTFDPEKDKKSYPDMYNWFSTNSKCKTEFKDLKYNIKFNKSIKNFN